MVTVVVMPLELPRDETTSCLSCKHVFVITACEPVPVCDVCLVLFCLCVVPGA